MEKRQVGKYLSLPTWRPSVLLQRRGEGYPWAPLRSEELISTAQTIVSLPGYRSALELDCGVLLELWGNLPEFSGSPPVLESVVMLHVPRSGADLELTLDRGRIHLVNRKPNGAAQVRIRFARDFLELTLPDSKSEICLDLWNDPPRSRKTAVANWRKEMPDGWVPRGGEAPRKDKGGK